MKLDLKPPCDVEITTGYSFHSQNRVILNFRRQPDITVIQDLLSLQSEYGWEVKDNREGLKFLSGDFEIVCRGALSADVGNALAKSLERNHGLKCQKVQRLSYKSGYSKLYQVEALRNDINVIEPSDIPLM